ncbi:AlpA family transcriptional regulator [Ferrovum sp.]|uniref:helix-turn-helix transcriptional regulator n=1 Tax=Ferrovum sp. TaxID=2609467 RepID=UPI00262B7F1A|nr:AlpA family transcriptional regulator [Ferrovum sp.]
MSARILRLDAVLDKTGLSRSLIYQLVSEGSFPAQIHLGARSVGWIEAEVDDWINTRIAMSRKATPSTPPERGIRSL